MSVIHWLVVFLTWLKVFGQSLFSGVLEASKNGMKSVPFNIFF